LANEGNLIPAKPGEIRNPKGRTKGVKNTATIIKKVLNTKIQLDKHPLTKKFGAKMTVREMITLAMVKAASEGNVTAFNTLIERIDGKVPQKLQADTGETGPMILCWEGEEPQQVVPAEEPTPPTLPAEVVDE